MARSEVLSSRIQPALPLSLPPPCPPYSRAVRATPPFAFMLLLAAIAYLDRICISTAAPAIRADLGLSDSEMGFVFSAFTPAYALFEVPSGWFADRFGARVTLTRIVVWWSAMTAATGLAGDLVRASRGWGGLRVPPTGNRQFISRGPRAAAQHARCTRWPRAGGRAALARAWRGRIHARPQVSGHVGVAREVD